jgi:hypothetical protein
MQCFFLFLLVILNLNHVCCDGQDPRGTKSNSRTGSSNKKSEIQRKLRKQQRQRKEWSDGSDSSDFPNEDNSKQNIDLPDLLLNEHQTIQKKETFDIRWAISGGGWRAMISGSFKGFCPIRNISINSSFSSFRFNFIVRDRIF